MSLSLHEAGQKARQIITIDAGVAVLGAATGIVHQGTETGTGNMTTREEAIIGASDAEFDVSKETVRSEWRFWRFFLLPKL